MKDRTSLLTVLGFVGRLLTLFTTTYTCCLPTPPEGQLPPEVNNGARPTSYGVVGWTRNHFSWELCSFGCIYEIFVSLPSARVVLSVVTLNVEHTCVLV